MKIKLVVLRQVMLFADFFGLPQNKVVPCGLLLFPKAVYKNERVKKLALCVLLRSEFGLEYINPHLAF